MYFLEQHNLSKIGISSQELSINLISKICTDFHPWKILFTSRTTFMCTEKYQCILPQKKFQ